MRALLVNILELFFSLSFSLVFCVHSSLSLLLTSLSLTTCFLSPLLFTLSSLLTLLPFSLYLGLGFCNSQGQCALFPSFWVREHTGCNFLDLKVFNVLYLRK